MSASTMSPEPRRRGALLLLGCTALLLCTQGSTLDAQVVRLRPVADVSVPTRFSLKDGGIQVRQKISLSLGARMTMTFNDRFDVAASVVYSPGSALLQGSSSRLELASYAHSVTANAGAYYWLLPRWKTLAWQLHTGVGVVFGGTQTYGDLLHRSMLTGVVGSTLLYHVGRLVTLKLKVQERLIRLHFGDEDFAAGPGRPFRVSFGLGFPFLERFR